MRILNYRDCLLPLVELLADGQVRSLRSLKQTLVDRVELTEDERQQWTESGLKAYVGACVAQAEIQLVKAGLLEKRGLGRVRITDVGRRVLAKAPTQITDRDLKVLRRRRQQFSPRVIPILLGILVVGLGMGWLGLGVQKRTAEHRFQQGLEACKQGEDYGRAVAYLSEAVRLDPSRAEAYYLRGAARLRIGDVDGALADLTIAVRVFPEWHEPYYWRGVAHMSLAEYDQAIDDYTEAIRLEPMWQAYARRGVAYSQKGRYDRAIDDFTKVIELHPTQPKAYAARARAYRAAGDDEKAERDEQKARELREGDDEES